jgi:hypothetical protein
MMNVQVFYFSRVYFLFFIRHVVMRKGKLDSNMEVSIS